MNWTISAEVPAGNIIVDRIEDDAAYIRQDQRGSTTRWFYWRFAVRGAQGRTLRFEFTDWDVIGTRGPCVSRDGGRSWHWLGRQAHPAPAFTYAFAPSDTDVQFCFCLPYLQADLDAFLARSGEGIRPGVLCRSPAGREVETLSVGAPAAAHRVLLTARHHACESSASFVLEGLLHAVAHAPPGAPEAWLRQEAHLLAVPFVDKDGVEDGDQGKDRHGHDHNRDYIATPRYPQTAALMQLAAGPFPPEVTVDLHCPWIHGEYNEWIYQVGSPFPDNWRAQRRFGRILERQAPAPLPYAQQDDLPWGQRWNAGPITDEQCSCTKWMARRPGVRLATSIEVPYANVRDVLVTPDALRAFGGQLAQALALFLQAPPAEADESE